MYSNAATALSASVIESPHANESFTQSVTGRLRLVEESESDRLHYTAGARKKMHHSMDIPNYHAHQQPIETCYLRQPPRFPTLNSENERDRVEIGRFG